MRMKNIIVVIVLTSQIISCSNEQELTELSENCACEATEHFITSTNEINNRTKKFTFTNSQLFDLGVKKDDFSKSFSLQIANLHEYEEEFKVIKINIETDFNGQTKLTDSYEYELNNIKKELPEYLKLESIITEFVVDIYNKNYSGCLELFEYENTIEFEQIIEDIRKDLNEGYISTKIVSYKKENTNYSIFGIIKSENDNLDLFKMRLKKIGNEFKLISFNF